MQTDTSGDIEETVERGQATRIQVRDELDVSLARRETLRLAKELGLSRALAYSVATAVSELANNLWLHARLGGWVEVCAITGCEGTSHVGQRGIEIAATDEGPGMHDIGRAMRDGFSTSGSLGGGLPGSARLMDEFSIRSQPGHGTRVVARKWSR